MDERERIRIERAGTETRHRMFGGQADWLAVEIRDDGDPDEPWVIWPVRENPRFAEDDPRRRAECEGRDETGVAIERAGTLAQALSLALSAVGLGEEGCLRIPDPYREGFERREGADFGMPYGRAGEPGFGRCSWCTNAVALDGSGDTLCTQCRPTRARIEARLDAAGCRSDMAFEAAMLEYGRTLDEGRAFEAGMREG